MNQRNGLFWDVIEGRASGPPAAELLGWELLDIDPDHGTIKLKFRPDKIRQSHWGHFREDFYRHAR